MANADILAGIEKPVIRVTFLGSDTSTVLHEVPGRLVSGQVGLERGRLVRGSARVVLVDEDGTYIPTGSAGLVWPYRLVRIESGVRTIGAPLFTSLLTGYLDDPTYRERSSEVTFSVWSRLRLMDRQFAVPLSFPETTRLQALVRTCCELAGLGVDDGLYDLVDGFATLSAERTFDTTENMLSAVYQLCYDHGLDGPYDDGDGKTILRAFQPPGEREPVYTFQPGETSLLTNLDWSLRGAMPVYNRVVVYGLAPDRYPIVGEWRDLNPLSPTYNPVDGTGPIGDQLAPRYISFDAHSQGQVNAIAERLGNEFALSDRPIRGNAVPIPFLRDRDVVRIIGAAIDTNVWLDQVIHPLGEGAMSFAARDARSLL